MFVENTTSPSALPVVPYASPRNTVPSSSTSTASMRSVTAAVILVPPSSLCGTPAPGRRHDGHHNDPSYLLQRPAGHPHPVVGTTDTTTIRHTSSNHSAYTDMSSALKPVSNNESPSCQVITSS